MTWIKTVPYEQADAELRRVYEAVRSLYPQEYAGDRSRLFGASRWKQRQHCCCP